ncbi:PRC-barrel domain protein [Clostridium botulinum C str. Eklund]|nr:PRC-barrel domain protein [Clostridium botulinum C str. Eklund]NEZ48320.1 YlmC/YmxH family sporulation protein [Clostridium botulinum]
MDFYSINNLKIMEVIDINTGCKIGFIKDLVVDCDECKILSLIIPKDRESFFGKEENIEIKWDDIIKIGIDVILVSISQDDILENK